MTRVSKPTSRLRQLLSDNHPLIIPGAYDCVSALILERAGFECMYMTGYGASASMLGEPDAGLISRGEMVSQARRIASAVNVPLVSDADDGFGNPVGVQRTVREFERAGVAAIHIEDQRMPKKCGHVEGKVLLTKDEMCQKIRAAVDAREDDDFVIIARTDARSVEGFGKTVERAEAYVEAGADIIFPESPYSVDEAEKFASELDDIDLLWNTATGRTTDGGKTPWVPVKELGEMGWSVVIFPAQTLWAAAHALESVAEHMKANDGYVDVLDQIMPFEHFNEIIGLSDIPKREEKYSTA